LDTGIKGRTALIAGASRNMGRYSALALAKEGVNLAICTSSRMKELNEVAEAARKLGVKVLAGQCDISDNASVEAFVKKARGEFGSVDIAVNVAGYRGESPLLEISVEEWNRNIAVNLTGPFHVCRNVIPLMKERGWGRIINFSGIAPYLGAYPGKAMVKLGIVGLTRGIAREFAEFGITANCIGAGTIGRGESDPTESVKDLRPSQPIRRKGRPDEVTALVVHLASENAGFITGQCYLVNGGMYMQ